MNAWCSEKRTPCVLEAYAFHFLDQSPSLLIAEQFMKEGDIHLEAMNSEQGKDAWDCGIPHALRSVYTF